MFVSGIKRCQFVVWKQGIFSVEVTDDPSFMSNVCAKLQSWTKVLRQIPKTNAFELTIVFCF